MKGIIVSEKELKSGIESGKISPNARVKRQGDAYWITAKEAFGETVQPRQIKTSSRSSNIGWQLNDGLRSDDHFNQYSQREIERARNLATGGIVLWSVGFGLMGVSIPVALGSVPAGIAVGATGGLLYLVGPMLSCGAERSVKKHIGQDNIKGLGDRGLSAWGMYGFSWIVSVAGNLLAIGLVEGTGIDDVSLAAFMITVNLTSEVLRGMATFAPLMRIKKWQRKKAGLLSTLHVAPRFAPSYAGISINGAF